LIVEYECNGGYMRKLRVDTIGCEADQINIGSLLIVDSCTKKEIKKIKEEAIKLFGEQPNIVEKILNEKIKKFNIRIFLNHILIGKRII